MHGREQRKRVKGNLVGVEEVLVAVDGIFISRALRCVVLAVHGAVTSAAWSVGGLGLH